MNTVHWNFHPNIIVKFILEIYIIHDGITGEWNICSQRFSSNHIKKLKSKNHEGIRDYQTGCPRDISKALPSSFGTT